MSETRTRSRKLLLQVPFSRGLIWHDQLKRRGVVAVTAQGGHAITAIEVAVHPLKDRWI